MARTTFAIDYRLESLSRCVHSVASTPRVAGAETLRALAQLACSHRFDLLGSGWIEVRHGMHCRGMEGHRYDAGQAPKPDQSGQWLEGRINHANLAECRRIWSLLDEGYVPIDWQLDFKSGYRWSERTWYRNISSAGGQGIDIKVPWELSRMQHLPQLALAAATGPRGRSDSESYAREFRNQVLDFIATNPPQFGVNWCCPMEVAIRVANWLLAYDLFRASGSVLDLDFESVFVRSIYEHGRHIVNNLEWLQELHGNHYLADVVGLAFVAAYLPRATETDAWLAFAVQELIREVEHQFAADGTNFEASVCYHRLSAEMVLYATALILGLAPEKRTALASYDCKALRTPRPLASAPMPLYALCGSNETSPFPAWYWERLEKAAEFTLHMTKSDGNVVQFGDNDSGRFCKIALALKMLTAAEATCSYANLAGYRAAPSEPYLDENHLDHRHLVAAVNAFYERPDLAAFAPPDASAWLISEMANHTRIHSYHQVDAEPAAAKVAIGADQVFHKLLARHAATAPTGRHKSVFSAKDGPGLNDRVACFGYPDFGAYVFRSPRLFLAVRCGSLGQSGYGGHAHLDQLAVELVIDGQTLLSDPGSYVYTALPERRNAYRSSRAHFVPCVQGEEPGDISGNLFRLDRAGEGECLYFGSLGFAGRHCGYAQPIYRLVVIEAAGVTVADFTESGAALEIPTPIKLPFAPGYGKQYRKGGTAGQCGSSS